MAGNSTITLGKTAKLKETSPRSTAHTDMSLAALQRPHLMLHFLNNLEKLLYNAYEGCAVAMPPPNKVSLFRFCRSVKRQLSSMIGPRLAFFDNCICRTVHTLLTCLCRL